MVVPILLYQCEVLGFTDFSIIENVPKLFLMLCLKLRKSTAMLYGETGRTSVLIIAKKGMLGS